MQTSFMMYILSWNSFFYKLHTCRCLRWMYNYFGCRLTSPLSRPVRYWSMTTLARYLTTFRHAFHVDPNWWRSLLETVQTGYIGISENFSVISTWQNCGFTHTHTHARTHARTHTHTLWCWNINDVYIYIYIYIYYDIYIYIYIYIYIITKIYIAHMQDGKINRQIESEMHKKVDLSNI